MEDVHGQYLGALCHSCNIAVFHNGGGYNFHFLRATSPRWALLLAGHREKSSARTRQGPRARQKKASLRPMSMAKAAPKPRPRRAKAPQAGVPPSPLQVGREVPADELGPAEVRGQHGRSQSSFCALPPHVPAHLVVGRLRPQAQVLRGAVRL